MKISILLFSFFIGLNNFSSACIKIESADTTSKPWRLNKQGFLKKYGDDDTSRALIRYWFDERHLLFGLTTASVLLGAAGSAGLLSLNTHGSDNPFSGIGYIVLVAAAIISLPVFLTAWLFRSRKKLFRLLSDHKEGKALRKSLIKRLNIKPVK